METDTGRTSKIITSFKCDRCELSCESPNGLKEHVASFHEEINPIKCDICNICFGLRSDWNKHMAAVHKMNKMVKCNWDSENSNGSEIVSSSQNNEKFCNANNESFIPTIQSVVTSKPIIKNDDNLGLESFSKIVKSVENYEIITPRENPFKCTKCDFSCRVEISMKTHVAVAHNGN